MLFVRQHRVGATLGFIIMLKTLGSKRMIRVANMRARNLGGVTVIADHWQSGHVERGSAPHKKWTDRRRAAHLAQP
jgi:hypothetical protein